MPDHIVLRIGGIDYVVPADLWSVLDGPRPDPNGFLDSDGCSFAPDAVRWLARRFGTSGNPIILFPACWIHDAQYRRVLGADLGGTWDARVHADEYLARNLAALCRAQGTSRAGTAIIVTTYWLAVRALGSTAFRYDVGKHPEGRLQRFYEAFMYPLEAPILP